MRSTLRPIVLIPARMTSSRLPGKPLMDIGGLPMIIHVWRCGILADVGQVVVAAGDQSIVDVVESSGGVAVLTRPDHRSGSDRIYEVIEQIDPQGYYNVVVNLQGDLPTIDPMHIRCVIEVLMDQRFDISTLATPCVNKQEHLDRDVVKIFVIGSPEDQVLPVETFSRSPISGKGFRHIGIYAFRREVLRRFVALSVSVREKEENLEQMRALDNDMTIGAVVVQQGAYGIDTPRDLEKARRFWPQ